MDHLFRRIPMLSDDQMYVIRHDRTGIACVSPSKDYPSKSVSDKCAFGLLENKQRILQHVGRMPVETADQQ